MLRDTRGPPWPNQSCKFPRFSIEISKIFFEKRCGPNPALAQTVSRPRYPLWNVLSHVAPLRTSGGCENATFRGASRHERRAKKIRPRGRVVSRAGSFCLILHPKHTHHPWDMSPDPLGVFLRCYATHVAPRGPNKRANFRDFQLKFRFLL